MMNTPPTKQNRSGYTNPFQIGSSNLDQDDVKYFHKLDVQDNFTRKMLGKDRRPAGTDEPYEGSPSAYSIINEKVASSLLARNDDPFRLLKIKPENEGIGHEVDQKYAPYKHNSKQFN